MSQITTRQSRFPTQRERWEALGGSWILDCDECGSYDPANPAALGKSIFLIGYPTQAAALAVGASHSCYPPAVAQHREAMADWEDDEDDDW